MLQAEDSSLLRSIDIHRIHSEKYQILVDYKLKLMSYVQTGTAYKTEKKSADSCIL